MFTGIIETLGEVKALKRDGENLNITISSAISPELRTDQSVNHNGVCLTVVAQQGMEYTVTAVRETLIRSNLGLLDTGSLINLERGMILGARLDGHLVQGHVDQIASCTAIEDQEGSWIFTFEYDPSLNNITVQKGSITIDGVSLTVAGSGHSSFSVAIIPYTYEHTLFKHYKVGSSVNLEFDVIGKYVARLLESRE